VDCCTVIADRLGAVSTTNPGPNGAVYIVSAARTPIGKFGGALASVAATELGAVAIRAAVERAGLDPGSAEVDEVLMGQVLQAGAGQAPARQAALGAGLRVPTPATTINRVCGSGLKAIMLAAAEIRAGDAELVVAGGMESMNGAPYLLPGARFGYRLGDGALVDAAVRDGLWCALEGCHMGTHAERVAIRDGVSRADQDAFALESHRRAVAAQDKGRFAAEMAPVTVRDAKGRETVVDADESPRHDTTTQALARLRPVFALPDGEDRGAAEEGTVTAGNAPGITDGAAATLVASERAVERLGLKPLALSRSRRGRSEARGSHRPAHRRLRPRRDQRGVRGPGARRRPRPRRRLGEGQRERRGDRPRPPDRGVRRPDRRDAPSRAAPAGGPVRPRHPLPRGRRVGGDGLRGHLSGG
jgi:acetyl-CoA acetyltransferase family protein